MGFFDKLKQGLTKTRNQIAERTSEVLKIFTKVDEALFEELGMNLSTAFNIFVRQSLREGGIPFMITQNTPSKETVAALLEAERIAKDSSVKGFHDVNKLFEDLDS